MTTATAANWALSAAPLGTPGQPTAAAVVDGPGRPDHRDRDGGQRLGHGQVDRARQRRRLADHRLPGPGGRQLDEPAGRVHCARPARPPRAWWSPGCRTQTAYRLQVAASQQPPATGVFSAPSNTVTPTSAARCPARRSSGHPPRGWPVGRSRRWRTGHRRPPRAGPPITGYQVTALRMSSSAADATVLSSTTSTGPRPEACDSTRLRCPPATTASRWWRSTRPAPAPPRPGRRTWSRGSLSRPQRRTTGALWIRPYAALLIETFTRQAVT